MMLLSILRHSRYIKPKFNFFVISKQTSVVRMIGAMTKTLKELVEAGSNQNQFDKSSHINPTPVPVPSSTSVCTWTNKIKDPSLQLTLPDSVTRVLLILWQCPVNANTVLSGECFFRLMRLFVRLPHTQGSRVLNSMKNYPSHLFASRLLKPLQEHLSLQLVSGKHILQLFFLLTFFIIYLCMHF